MKASACISIPTVAGIIEGGTIGIATFGGAIGASLWIVGVGV